MERRGRNHPAFLPQPKPKISNGDLPHLEGWKERLNLSARMRMREILLGNGFIPSKGSETGDAKCFEKQAGNRLEGSAPSTANPASDLLAVRPCPTDGLERVLRRVSHTPQACMLCGVGTLDHRVYVPSRPVQVALAKLRGSGHRYLIYPCCGSHVMTEEVEALVEERMQQQVDLYNATMRRRQAA